MYVCVFLCARLDRHIGRVDFLLLFSSSLCPVCFLFDSRRGAAWRGISHRIASHRIASHRIASHRIVSMSPMSPPLFSRALVTSALLLLLVVVAGVMRPAVADAIVENESDNSDGGSLSEDDAAYEALMRAVHKVGEGIDRSMNEWNRLALVRTSCVCVFVFVFFLFFLLLLLRCPCAEPALCGSRPLVPRRQPQPHHRQPGPEPAERGVRSGRCAHGGAAHKKWSRHPLSLHGAQFTNRILAYTSRGGEGARRHRRFADKERSGRERQDSRFF